jgi:hypothetical protein
MHAERNCLGLLLYHHGGPDVRGDLFAREEKINEPLEVTRSAAVTLLWNMGKGQVICLARAQRESSGFSGAAVVGVYFTTTDG